MVAIRATGCQDLCENACKNGLQALIVLRRPAQQAPAITLQGLAPDRLRHRLQLQQPVVPDRQTARRKEPPDGPFAGSPDLCPLFGRQFLHVQPDHVVSLVADDVAPPKHRHAV